MSTTSSVPRLGLAQRQLGTTFRSLGGFNYRTWALGALVSNIGTWMQRTAQDWIVLTQLTDNSATAMGLVMALQFSPQVLLLPVTGYAADHFDRRKLLFATQASLGVLALALGLLTVTGLVRLWHVDLLAFLLGCTTAFDAPARHAFVSDLVGEEDLPNAVGLNSASFNAARMVGPAVAGLLIAVIGSGWVFLLNAASFVAVLWSLTRLRLPRGAGTTALGTAHGLRERPEAGPGSGGVGEANPPGANGRLTDGFVYVWRRPGLRTVLLMLFLVGTFALSFPIFIATMAVRVFHEGAGHYGLLTSTMAVGSVTGALLSARRGRPRLGVLLSGAALLGVGLALAGLSPTYGLFSVALVVVGTSAQTFTTTVASTVQLSADREVRGRVMAIMLAIAMGGQPIGAPIAGWVADRFGPRWSLGVGAAGCFAAFLAGVVYLARYGHLRLRREAGRLRLSLDDSLVPAGAD